MIIGTAKVYLTADWVKSLKDKRMVIKSIIAKTHNKFNVSIAEIELNDVHKSIALGIAVVTNEQAHADNVLANVIYFIENNTDAEIVDIIVEIL